MSKTTYIVAEPFRRDRKRNEVGAQLELTQADAKSLLEKGLIRAERKEDGKAAAEKAAAAKAAEKAAAEQAAADKAAADKAAADKAAADKEAAEREAAERTGSGSKS